MWQLSDLTSTQPSRCSLVARSRGGGWAPITAYVRPSTAMKRTRRRMTSATQNNTTTAAVCVQPLRPAPSRSTEVRSHWAADELMNTRRARFHDNAKCSLHPSAAAAVAAGCRGCLGTTSGLSVMSVACATWTCCRNPAQRTFCYCLQRMIIHYSVYKLLSTGWITINR